VWRNDDIDFSRVSNFDKILISPGPGMPKESNQLMDFIKHFAKEKDILGVCLGCQALGEYFGAKLYNLEEVKHGVQTPIYIKDHSVLFQGLTDSINVGRYHSWALNIKQAESLLSTSIDSEGVLMSFRHNRLPVYGIQFHPESIMTNQGRFLIKNWIQFKY
jgi:anthranilate synthase component 2